MIADQSAALPTLAALPWPILRATLLHHSREHSISVELDNKFCKIEGHNCIPFLTYCCLKFLL